MDYVLLGVLGFIVGYGFELASAKRVTRLKPVLAIAVAGLLTYSTVMVSLDSGRFWLPVWLQAVGGIILPVSLLLLLFSMFLELPFAATYQGRTDIPRLVTTGTYALVRHPTVPWYVLMLGSLLLLTRSELLLVALPVWVLLTACCPSGLGFAGRCMGGAPGAAAFDQGVSRICHLSTHNAHAYSQSPKHIRLH